MYWKRKRYLYLESWHSSSCVGSGVDNIFLPQNRDVPEQNKSNHNVHHRRLHLTAAAAALCATLQHFSDWFWLVLMRGIMDQFLIRDECWMYSWPGLAWLRLLSISICTGLARSASCLVYLWQSNSVVMGRLPLAYVIGSAGVTSRYWQTQLLEWRK